jgi:protein O-GlcNAc transferase
MKKTAKQRHTPVPTAVQTNQLAVGHHRAGRLVEAAACYRQVLEIEPDNFDALHLLGLLTLQSGNPEQAITLICQALEHNPTDPAAHNNLGNALDALGRLQDAITCYQAALSLKPDYADAINNLGGSLKTQGKLEEAVECFRKALALHPTHIDALYNLGSALQTQGKRQEAAACYRKVLALKPNHADAHYKLGLTCALDQRLDEALAHYQHALKIDPAASETYFQLAYVLNAQGKRHEAVECYKKTITLKPDYAAAHYNLGNVLYASGRLREALTCYQNALTHDPKLAEAYFNLGNTLNDLHELDLAIGCYKQAVALKPDYAEAHNNMGSVLKWQGKLDEALASYQTSRAVKDTSDVHSNILQLMLYSAKQSAEELFTEFQRFAEKFEAPLKPHWLPHTNQRDPERRLRLGYVSADFRSHSVAFFIEPIIAGHNRSEVEVFCYYNHREHDSYTDRIKSVSDHWIPCRDMSDDALAERIRSDGIDILVDLSNHSGHQRLLVFARKPAPVQVTWMGTPSTTGLTAMDYKLTNEHMDPPGLTERFHTETLVRLQASAAYQPPAACPPVNQLPALSRERFMFACLNNPAKINQEVVAIWARILNALPNADLMLGNVDGDGVRARLTDMFNREDIDADRLVMQPKMSLAAYMQIHHQIDLALDPFPYNGGTTTRHALWMGVPVLTMAGDNSMSRVGSAIMSRARLPKFIVNSEAEYLKRAIQIAHELSHLNHVRQTLRERLSSDTENNGAGFAHNLEREFRAMWRTWCASAGGSTS